MTDLLKLIQVEDSLSDAELIVRVLQNAGYQVRSTRVEDAPAMREALASQPWDAIISDHRMAGFNAPDALRVLQESGRDIPFIVVSGSIGDDFAVSLMKAGAHDYLLKNNLNRLVPAIEREIKEARVRQERRQADRELRESEERLALAVKATQSGTFDFEPQSGKLVWSEAARQHFGLFTAAPPSYELFLACVHPEDRDRVRTAVEGALSPESGGYYADEYRAIGIDDRVERWIAARGKVFFDASNQPVRFVGVVLDITDRKKLEDQFRQAQKLESIGRLAGGVAHDFNNILTVVTGYTEMILSELPAQDPLRDSIEEIAKAAVRARDLTRQLLSFSRRSIVQPKTILVNDLLRDFEKMLGRLLGEQVELLLQLEAGVGAIRADAGQIEQVLMNLAVNAKDAMADGGRLLIETSQIIADEQFSMLQPSVQPGSYVMIAVSDTGAGMSAEVQAHIFEPFFTTKEAGKGTGLGLATVYGIVRQSGGFIWVYSEPGRGSTFRVLFPEVDAELGSPRITSALEPPSGNGETVLLVEDEAAVRKYASHVLSRNGYRVLDACNDREALAVAGRHREQIGLLLLDVVLPGRSIVELTRQLKSLCLSAPVLCMSGYSDLLLPKNEPGTHFIPKPFTPVSLLTRIHALLAQRG